MEISALDPVEKAWKRMIKVCFDPFDISKWLKLGFCAWLAQLGQGGGGNFQIPGGGGGGEGWEMPEGEGTEGMLMVPFEISNTLLNPNWLQETLFSPLAIGIGVGILILITFLVVLMSWLNSRGTFMFIDGIVHNRGAVKEPWEQYKEQGNSLFKLNLGLGLGFLGVLATFSLLSVLLFVYVGIENPMVVVGFAIMMLLMIPLIFALIFVSWFINTLVVPTMYTQKTSWRQALHSVRTNMLPGQASSVLVLMFIQIGMAIGTSLIVTLFTCFTCCIAALPFVGTVMMLPLFVFLRSYTLYFVDQFGANFSMFHDETEGVSASF